MRSREAYALGGVGRVHYRLGEYTPALSHFEAMLGAAQAAGKRDEEVSALSWLGDVKQAQGEFQAAVDYYARALKRSRSDDPERARVKSSIGWVYYKLNDYQRALDHLLEAYAAYKKRNADAVLTINRIGRIHDELGQHRAAVRFFKQALALTQDDPARSYEMAP